MGNAHVGPVYYITTRHEWFQHINNFVESHYVPLDNTVPLSGPDEAANDPTPICVVVVTHESKHWELENDPAWDALPHPLSRNPVKQEHLTMFKGHPGIDQQRTSQQALAPGQPLNLNTFQLVNALAQSHPLLGWRIF